MKKILMLNYEFPPLGGGAGNATYNLLKEFSLDPTLHIDLITSSLGKGRVESLSKNICVYFVDIGKTKNAYTQPLKDILLYTIKGYLLAKRLKKENSYDLIHAFFGVPSGLMAYALKLPYVISLRGSDVPGFNPRFRIFELIFLKSLSKHIWTHAFKVTTNSESLKDLAQKTGPLLEFKVIPNGVNTTTFSPSPKNNIFTVISTSRLTSRKGIDLLIRGFSLFSNKKTDVRLLIVGNGDQETALKKLALTFPTTHIEFMDSVSNESLVVLYQRADVFCLPSHTEGMSNSLLEAMASGLAIVCSPTGDALDITKDCGICIKRTPESIAEAFEKLYEDRTMLEEFKKESRQKALSMDWKKTALAYKNIYNS
jgi:glycosyltransferase involved in cell wall biosynthesis